MGDATATDPHVPGARRRRWPWVVLALLALIAIALGAGYAWLGSDAALQLALREATTRTGGALTFANVEGSLLSEIRVGSVRYEREGTVVAAEDVRLAWSPRALLAHTVRITALSMKRLEVRSTKQDDTPPELPESLALPMAVIVDRASVDVIDIASGPSHWEIAGLSFGYAGGPTQHALRDLALRADAGTLGGSLTVGASKPYALDGKLVLAGTEAMRKPVLNVTVGGNVEAIELAATGTAVDATLQAKASMTPLEKVALRSFAVDVRSLDLGAIDAALPRTKLDVAINGAGAENFTFTGEVRASNGNPGAIDAQRVPLVSVESRYRLTPKAIELTALQASLNGGGRVSGSGTLLLSSESAAASESAWRLDLHDVNARAIYSTLVRTSLSGSVRADVAQGRQHVVADVRERDLALAFDATIAGTKVAVARFAARARDGELSGRGDFDWSGARRFDVSATAARLDPSRFGDFPQASIDAVVEASGALEPKPGASVRLTLAPTTRVRGTPVRGTVQGTFARDRVRDLVADVVIASTTASARGSFGAAGDRLQLTIDSPDLRGLAPVVGPTWPQGLAGTVRAEGHLDGSPSAFGFGVDARGRNVSFGTTSLANAELHANVPVAAGTSAAVWRARPLDIKATAAGIVAGGTRYDRAAVTFAGSLADHTASLAVTGEDVDARAQLQGGFAPEALVGGGPLGWSGTVLSLQNAGAYPARLLGPAHIEASAARVVVQGARVAVAEGNVTIATLTWTEGRITTRGDFANLPVAAVARLAGATLPLRTNLVLAGEWDVAATPRLNGRVTLRRQSGDVYVGSTEALEAGEIALGMSELTLDVTLQDDVVHGNAALRAVRLGSLAATATIGQVPGAAPGRITAAAPLDATVTGNLASLAPFQPFLGTAAVVEGSLGLDVRVTGTLGAPNASGTLTARNMRIDSPKYGISWHDGSGEARIGDGAITLRDVSFRAGDGRLAIEGSAPLSGLDLKHQKAGETGPRLTWRAEKFRATNRPDLRLIISGEGNVGVADGKVALRGNVRLEEGRIDFQRTPGATLSADVIVDGRPKPAPKMSFEDLPLGLDIQVDLGRRLRISGEGIRATLQGSIRVTTGPNGTIQAHGTLNTVDGTYLAFGQQLQIDRGRLVFSGPLDNPGLDILALRKNLPVEAGVTITGTARLPQVQLTSNPPVPEGEKLSWLVLGQGLERSSGADLAALQAAAGALFGGRGPGFGTRIAERIGLDDLSVRSNPGAAGGSSTQVLALSKRLTDRLYLVFEQGIDLANNALRLDYLLTRSLTVRAQAGTVSSVGLYFLRSFQ